MMVTLRYRAFLSYSHTTSGAAARVQKRLEAFVIDKDWIGRPAPIGPIPDRLYPIFRDRNDFSAGEDLEKQTRDALDASAAMVLLGSPGAAASRYVNLEVRYFRQHYPDRPVIPLIVGGRQNAAMASLFPPAYRWEVDAEGRLGTTELTITAADERSSGDGPQLGLAKVIARLLGLHSDIVFKRVKRTLDEQAFVRNAMIATILALVVFVGGLGLWGLDLSRKNAENDVLIKRLVSTAPVQLAPGQEQSLTQTITALASGARTDPRQAQALALLREGKTQEAAALLLAVAETGEANIGAEKKRTAEAYRQAASIAGLRDPKQARALYAKAAGLDPDDIDGMRLHGEFERDAGNLPEADRAFRQVIAIGQAGRDDDALIWANFGMGDVLMARGDVVAAQAAFIRGGAIAERPAKGDPGNAGWQRDLSVFFNKIGDVLVAQGKGDEAMKAYRDSLVIAERLAKGDPGNARLQRDLSISLNKIGDVLVAQGKGKGDEAMKAYRDSLAIRERLTKDDPGNARWQRDVAVSFNKIGDVLRAQGKGDEAMKAYRDSSAIFERLAKDDPGNAGWQRDVAVSVMGIALVQRGSGKTAEALTQLRRGREIMVGLVALDPNNAGWWGDLALFDRLIAVMEK